MSNQEKHASSGYVPGPPTVAEFRLKFRPTNGAPIWIPFGERVQFLFDGVFELETVTREVSTSEAERIAEAVQVSTENPGRTVSVDDPWKGFTLTGDKDDEVQR